eukprot:10900850-Alexandrium_andersonii.AAC.1
MSRCDMLLGVPIRRRRWATSDACGSAGDSKRGRPFGGEPSRLSDTGRGRASSPACARVVAPAAMPPGAQRDGRRASPPAEPPR